MELIVLCYPFFSFIRRIIKRFAEDERCEVHQAIFPVREGKDGWVDLFSPGGVSCGDNGEFFAHMVSLYSALRCFSSAQTLIH